MPNDTLTWTVQKDSTNYDAVWVGQMKNVLDGGPDLRFEGEIFTGKDMPRHA